MKDKREGRKEEGKKGRKEGKEGRKERKEGRKKDGNEERDYLNMARHKDLSNYRCSCRGIYFAKYYG